jgi:hypothetical protein
VLACTSSIYPRWHISRPEALPYCTKSFEAVQRVLLVRYQPSLQQMGVKAAHYP